MADYRITLRLQLRQDTDEDYYGDEAPLWAYWRYQRQDQRRNQLGIPFRVAKLLQYTLLGPPTGISAAKIVQYVLLLTVQPALLGGPPELQRRVYAAHRNDVPDDDYSPAWRIVNFNARDLQSALFGTTPIPPSPPPPPPPPPGWPLNVPYQAGLLLDSRADDDFAPPALLRAATTSAYRSALSAAPPAPALPLARPDPYMQTWMARRYQWDADTTGMKLTAAHRQAGHTRSPLRGSRYIQVG